MNDFTKEELKFISDYIYLGVREKKNHELLLRLDDKIQSLIDGYCDKYMKEYNEEDASEALRDYQAMNLAWVANLVRKTLLENRSVHTGSGDECESATVTDVATKECEHESDGETLTVPYPELTPPEIKIYNKCKHCGEFFR